MHYDKSISVTSLPDMQHCVLLNYILSLLPQMIKIYIPT